MIKYHISFTCFKNGIHNSGDCFHERNSFICNKNDINSIKENILLSTSCDKNTVVITNIIRLPI
jgi:hypothetical protein